MQTLNALIYPQYPATIVERRRIDVATIPPHKAFWWRPVVVIGDDPFDSITQKKTGPVTTIETNRVLDTYKVVSLTASELSDRKDATISRIDALHFLVAFDMENRMRVLEAKPVITEAQYRTALEDRL